MGLRDACRIQALADFLLARRFLCQLASLMIDGNEEKAATQSLCEALAHHKQARAPKDTAD